MEFIIILLLLILNGIFAMYEIALVSSSKARLETLVGKGNKRAKGVLKQLEEPEKFLSTIQIGITLIGIVSGAYGVLLVEKECLGEEQNEDGTHAVVAETLCRAGGEDKVKTFRVSGCTH